MKSDPIVCDACQPDAKKAEKRELEEFLEKNDNWKLVNEAGISKLSKSYKFKNFVHAQMFANKVCEIAEIQGHHPSILLEYGLTTINWWSQKIKGIHEMDISSAKATDRLFKDFENDNA